MFPRFPLQPSRRATSQSLTLCPSQSRCVQSIKLTFGATTKGTVELGFGCLQRYPVGSPSALYHGVLPLPRPFPFPCRGPVLCEGCGCSPHTVLSSHRTALATPPSPPLLACLIRWRTMMTRCSVPSWPPCTLALEAQAQPPTPTSVDPRHMWTPTPLPCPPSSAPCAPCRMLRGVCAAAAATPHTLSAKRHSSVAIVGLVGRVLWQAGRRQVVEQLPPPPLLQPHPASH